MQPPNPQAPLQSAVEEAVPLGSEDMARRVSIQALVGSPEAPRPINGFQNISPVSYDQVIEKAPPMIEAVQPSVAPSVLVGGQWGLSNRPHPVKQLQGAVAKGRRNKKHICEFPGCGREFSRKSNLEAHSRKHMTGAQATPYACQHCARRFKWRSSLKSHEAGCMHQSLPNAIQRQQRLEQRRLEMHRQYVEEQERLKTERRNSQRVSGRWPPATLQSQGPPHGCGPSASTFVTGTHLSVNASPVSAAKGSDFPTGTPLQESVKQDMSLRDRGYVSSGTQPPLAHSATGIEQDIHRAPDYQSASRSYQAGMLTSLRLPPLGLGGKP